MDAKIRYALLHRLHNGPPLTDADWLAAQELMKPTAAEEPPADEKGDPSK